MDLFHLKDKNKQDMAMIGEDGFHMTYGELVEAMERMKPVFREAGSKDLVICLCENELGAVAGYLGAMYSGMVPLLLDAHIDHEKLQAYMDRYDPRFLWGPSGVGLDDSKGVCVFSEFGYQLWDMPQRCQGKMYEHLGLLLTTSGSTGDPKTVRLSYENLISNAQAICEYLQITNEDRPITTLPMYYTYGLSILHSHLLAGATILMARSSYVSSEFWEFLEREHANSFSGVPYTYEILRKMHVFRRSYPGLKKLTQAGGKLSESLQKQVADWADAQGSAFYIMYGQTEATARMGYLPPEDVQERAGSMGKAIPGGRFWLEDEEHREITGPEEIGELIYQGPNVSLGYASCREDLQKADERHGILYTGDLAKRDAQGYYYIVGRKKRFIKIYGNRVNLDACEAYLRGCFPEWGAELVCMGGDDHCEIYLAAGAKQNLQEGSAGEALADQMVEKLSEYLHLNRKAFRGIVVEQIPKNKAGKVLYEQLI